MSIVDLTAPGRVVVDCYGTLVVPPPRDHRTSVRYIHERLGLSEKDCKLLVYPLFIMARDPKVVWQQRTSDYFAKRLEELGLSTPLEEVLDAFGRSCGSHLGAESVLPGAATALERLRAGGYEVVLLSNCVISKPQMDGFLADAGLAHLFDEIHLSSHGVPKKPNPEAFAVAAGGWPSTHLSMVGDSSRADIAVPAEMGWRTALVRDVSVEEATASWSAVMR